MIDPRRAQLEKHKRFVDQIQAQVRAHSSFSVAFIASVYPDAGPCFSEIVPPMLPAGDPALKQTYVKLLAEAIGGIEANIIDLVREMDHVTAGEFKQRVDAAFDNHFKQRSDKSKN